MPEIISSYMPHPKQIEAHIATEQFVGYGGAMGGGKTRWLCEMAKMLSLEHPENFGLLCRQSGPALKLSTQEVFFSEVLIPGSDEWKALGCEYRKAEGILTFRHNGSKIWFTGLDSDNTERIKSLNLGFFGIDEATEVAESIFLMLCTRLRRAGIPKAFRKGLISANPEAGWIKRRFIDQALKNHKFIFANFADNPHLPKDYPELFETMPQRWRDKYLYGRWEAASGLIYKSFDPEFHIIPAKRVIPEWKKIRGLDHGQQNPAACIGLCVVPNLTEELHPFIGDRLDGRHPEFSRYPVLIAYKLYYATGLVSDHRRGIHSLYEDDHRIVATNCDPSIWRKDREKKVVTSSGGQKSVDYSIAEQYQEHPYPLQGMRKATNSILPGLDRIEQLLRIGHLFFMEDSSLEPLISDSGEIRNYQWKQPPNDSDNWPEQPVKRDDHACDALRYAVMSLPPPATKEEPVNPNSFDSAIKRTEVWHKSRTYQDAVMSVKGIGNRAW